MLLVLLIIFLLLAFTLVFYVVYKWVQPLRYRATIRTWLVVFYAEIIILFFIPKHIVDLSALPMLHKEGGYYYLIVFTTDWSRLLPDLLRGQSPEERLLLLLPLLPALLVFLYTRRHPLSSLPPPPKPEPDAP